MSDVFAARIDGPCDDHLSVHSTFEGAVDALLQVSRTLHLDRFGYVPLDLQDEAFGQYRSAQRTLGKIENTMTGSGWRARVVELVVDHIEDSTAAAI